MPANAMAQTIIPVDPRFPPPDGFSFEGSWKCGGPSAPGVLVVGKASNRNGWRSGALTSTWTEIGETEQELVGNYFVAYDRDKQQFIMIDADDPAYAAYSTAGWRDRQLTLTSEQTQLMPRHRLVFRIDDRHQLTVMFAVWDSATWNTNSSFACRRTVSGEGHR
jgi:hypothetical protein